MIDCGQQCNSIGDMGTVVGRELLISRLYKKKYSVGSIARRIGVATAAVSEKLERMGLRERINPKRVSPSKCAEIGRLYRSGVGSSDIADSFGICLGTVRAIAKKQGCKIHPKGGRYREFTQSQVSEMAKMWKSGHSQYGIAQRFGSSQITIGRVLRSAGFKKETRHASGERHACWKGGHINLGGYRFVMMSHDHRFASMRSRVGYVAEHRLNMAEHLGRPLTGKEVVHHINGNRLDNRIENLELRRRVDHQPGIRLKCAACGSCNVVPY